MFQSRSNKERRIFFPWEGRGALRRFFARGRMFSIFVVVLLTFIVVTMVKRERYAAGVRLTVVALYTVRPLVERYLTEREGKCPTSLDEVRLVQTGQALPRDAWGRPLRLVCPSGRPGIEYVLMSDGPDGLPGGTDRIEE
jgi:general secretion pathway protein G